MSIVSVTNLKKVYGDLNAVEECATSWNDRLGLMSGLCLAVFPFEGIGRRCFCRHFAYVGIWPRYLIIFIRFWE